MQEHEREERPKFLNPKHRQNGYAAEQVTYGHELFRSKIPVGELIAKKHGGDRSDGEGVVYPGSLPVLELEELHIAVKQWQPGAPDQQLEHHHQEKFETDCLVHALVLRLEVHWKCTACQLPNSRRIYGSNETTPKPPHSGKGFVASQCD